jgi:hypothetical protein
MTKDEMKEWIDTATREQLLSKWRFAKLGDPFFQTEIGEYYANVLFNPKNKSTDFDKVSKKVGWENKNDYNE